MKKKVFLKKLKTEYIGRGFSTVCGLFIVILTICIIFFVLSKGIQLFMKGGSPLKSGYSLKDFLFSLKWKPDAKSPSFGADIFMAGSTLVSIGAVLISTPIGIAVAIFMNFISPKLGEKVLKPALELFVGIPSVVYGWVGITILVPFIKSISKGIGFSLLSGILVLSVMILPTIASLTSDAIKEVPYNYREASYGLGATRWQTISKVIIPAAKDGIFTGIILGLARAFGEALAVQMVIGNSIRIADSLFNPTSTLTGILTMDMANTVQGTAWNNALWALAALLLLMSFVFILIIKLIGKRSESK